MKTLSFIFYIIDHTVCDQLLPHLKQNQKNVFDNILGKIFLNTNPIFLD